MQAAVADATARLLWKVVIELSRWMAQKKCADRQVHTWVKRYSAGALKR